MKQLTFLFIALLIVAQKIFSQGYICAVGGGSENYNDWSDEPYRWIVQKSDSGKIIILSYSDATNWLPNYFMWLGADTAYNKTISSTTIANLQSTYDELITAKAIFLRGGDQYQYIRLWKGTKTEEAIKYVFQNGGVIAGTSAGAMVLSEFDFSAQSGSVYPDEALQNPFNSKMRFENNFLNLMPNVLFDTHLMERGRHGRLIGFVYNIFYSFGRKIIGVGIDDRTAICISPDKVGEVMGSGSVSIFYLDDKTRTTNVSAGKYTIENLKAHILTKNWKFDFQNLEVSYIPPSAKSVDTSRSFQLPITNIYLTGTNDIALTLNTSFAQFLNSVNSNNVLVISYPGFTNQNLVTNYLQSNNYNFSVLNIDASILDNPTEALKISNSTCIVVVGDSLNRLAMLNQTGRVLSDTFLANIQSGKPIFFFGNSGKIVGEYFVDNVDTDNLASYRGRMTNNQGLAIFGDFIFQPRYFENADFYENRTSALLWGMMRNRKRFGVYLHGNSLLQVFSNKKSLSGKVTIPFVVVDTREAAFVDSSTYRASSSIGPRQVVAFDNLRISLTNYSEIEYLLDEGKFNSLTKNEDEVTTSKPNEFILVQNYPNPFNSKTKIAIKASKTIENQSTGYLKIFDLVGREIKTFEIKGLENGRCEIEFDGSSLSSGVYFYKFSLGPFSATRKMILLK